MVGLSHTPTTTAAMLLTFEAVFTTATWFAFGEHYDRRIASGWR